ncbi:MAG: hypothetical protein Q7S60_00470 [bacterium]|nr:hypothetical protein [bacterium]
MISRYSRLQERRKTRSAFFLFSAAIGLLLILIFLGIPLLSRFAVFVSELKGSSSPIVIEDKTPPAPPYINALPKFTKDNKIKVTGRAEAGSVLRLFQNSAQIKEFIVDDTSNFEIEVKLLAGNNSLYTTATDNADNENRSSTWDVLYDLEPPAVEVSSPTEGASFFGDEKTIDVRGKTEAEAQVSVNDRVAIVNGSGEFSLRLTLSEGENTITVTAIDQAENKTEKTVKVTYSP